MYWKQYFRRKIRLIKINLLSDDIFLCDTDEDS